MIAFPSFRGAVWFIAGVITPVYIIFLYKHFITNISVPEYVKSNSATKIHNITNTTRTNQTKILPEEASSFQTKIDYKCDWPKLDPFDPSIIEAYSEKLAVTPKSIDCAIKKFPMIFKTDLDSNLIMTRSPSEVGLERCCYKKLIRVEGQDTNVRYSDECIKLTNTTTKIPADYEFVAVICLDTNRTVETTPAQPNSASHITTSAPTPPALNNNATTGAQSKSSNATVTVRTTTNPLSLTTEGTPTPTPSHNLRIVDILPLLCLKPKVEKRIAEIQLAQKDDDAFSVIILGVDSMSYMNLLRTMPKTNKFFTEDLGAIRMDGFNTLRSNTLPNLSAALAGYSMEDLFNLCSPEFKPTLDTCPFIWKNFSAQGYRTSFDEDGPRIAIFNHRRNGFEQPPTDYYLRPLMHGQYITIGHREDSDVNLCHGPRMAVDILLNRMHNMAKVMGKRKYFQFIWTTSVTHDIVTYPTLQDSLFYGYLKSMKEEGLLENKIMIFMSDHGIRWNFQNSYQGQMEARMPFLFVVLPERLRTKFPEAVANLKENANRLVSPFDVHKTLLHILEFDKISTTGNVPPRFYTQGIGNSTTQFGISLFKRIPTNRTCNSAGISEHYCICNKMTRLAVNETLVMEAAEILVAAINDKIVNKKNCAKLTRANISESYDLVSSGLDLPKEFSDETDTTRILRLTVETVPGNAKFETTMSRSMQGDWDVLSESRVNKYGNQSSCVLDPELKNYCFCKVV